MIISIFNFDPFGNIRFLRESERTSQKDQKTQIQDQIQKPDLLFQVKSLLATPSIFNFDPWQYFLVERSRFRIQIPCSRL